MLTDRRTTERAVTTMLLSTLSSAGDSLTAWRERSAKNRSVGYIAREKPMMKLNVN